MLWTDGSDPADPQEFRALAARGVFGVPSFVVESEVFWGADALDFVKACLADPAILSTTEMRRLDTLPVGASRTR